MISFEVELGVGLIKLTGGSMVKVGRDRESEEVVGRVTGQVVGAETDTVAVAVNSAGTGSCCLGFI